MSEYTFPVEDDEDWHVWQPGSGMPAVAPEQPLKVGCRDGAKTGAWGNRAKAFDWDGKSFIARVTHYATKKAFVQGGPDYLITALMELKP